ncbi:MAG TPA: M48 family metallopeptidase, partial [Gallionellaceae bacterium]
IVQHPRFGLFGWEENYLILGLPLLQTLNEEESFAVVAHEYGHLSGHHSRLGGFIYRFRMAWGRLQQMSEQWNDWGSRLIARLFKWYAPYFNAYTFVLARQNEYMADRSSMEMVGQQHTANMLMRIKIAAQFEDREFWPSINRRVAKEPEPFDSRSTFWSQSMHTVLDADMRERFLEEESKRKTDHLDTHPALTDRLAAMGVEIDLAAARTLEAPATSAAQAWLGNRLEAIKAEFDRAWRDDVADNWHSRHAYLKEREERLAALEAQAEASTEEQWERISILDELKPDADLLPLLNTLLQQLPTHASALFRRGALLLERGDEAGIADLEAVMRQDDESILTACETAWRFYKTRSPEKAEEYSRRWQERSDHLEQVRSELASLPADANLVEPDLSEDALEHIRNILREHGKHIKKAYVMRRVLKSDSSVPDYVLAFETGWLTLGDKGPEVVKRLVQQEFPGHFFVVHLGGEPYKRFRKSIKRMKLEPLQYR